MRPCLPSTIICLLLSVYLSVCFVNVSVCVSRKLEIHGPEKTNKIKDVGALASTIFHLSFTPTLYDKNMPFVITSGIWEC